MDAEPVDQASEQAVVASPGADVLLTPPGETPNDPPRELSDWRRLDGRFLKTERIGSLIFSAVLIAGGAIPVLLDLAFGWWNWIARASVWPSYAALVAVLLWSSIVWPRMQIAATSYRFGAGGIEIRRGVWWRRLIRVPRSRMQHTDVTQGPLLRRYGLASLTVHTAATNTPSITISGLAHEDALAVRDALNDPDGGDGV